MKIKKKKVYFVTSKKERIKKKTDMIGIYHSLLEELQTDSTNNINSDDQDEELGEVIIVDSML